MSEMPTQSATVPTVLEHPVATSPTLPHNGREARNLAEKHRRDKLNASIQELATMVPHVADSTRRMDKTAVLRFAAHGLRLQYVFGKSAVLRNATDDAIGYCGDDDVHTNMQYPTQTQLPDALMHLLDSFFITLTCHGQIVLISSSVEQLLGHCQSDLYGQNILHIVHPEDQALMLQQLIPHNMEALFRNDDEATDDDVLDDRPEEDDEYELSPTLHSLRRGRQHRHHESTQFADIDKSLREDRRCFTVRLARAGTRSETTRKYEIVMIDGLFRRSDFSASAGNLPIVSQLIRRSRNSSCSGGTYASNMPQWMQHDVAIAQAALHGISGNDIVLVAMARVIRPPKAVGRLLEANNLEYRTRHLIDGRIIDCDQRISLVAGYMKDEVRNLCPFTFMHQDDVRWVIVALRQMYDCNSDYGESCYRLLSRNGHFIYLQTKGYLEIDKSTNKVHSFVCVNTLLDEEVGRRKVQEMKKKFSIIIKAKIPSNSLEDVPASQNPQQLERIVLYLIENLQKRHNNYGGGSLPTAAYATSKNNATIQSSDDNTQLALVPPEPDSVKSSISKSVNIVNVTAAKNLHYNQKSPASYLSSDISLSPASSIDHSDDLCMEHMTTSSVISPPPPSLAPSHLMASSQRPSVLVQMSKLPQQQHKQVIVSKSATTSATTTKPANGTRDRKVADGPISPASFAKMIPQNISVLKRMKPPPNACLDESSPAKRSPPLTLPAVEPAVVDLQTVLVDSIQTLDVRLQNFNNKLMSLDQPLHFAEYSLASPTVEEQQMNASLLESQEEDMMLDIIKTEYDEQ